MIPLQENSFGYVANIQYFVLIKSVILPDVILCKNNKFELALC